MHVVAVQEILGHEWLNPAMIYVHVEKSHAEDAWIPIRTRLSTTPPVPDQESGPAA
jgi:site-specific recombinase XerD